MIMSAYIKPRSVSCKVSMTRYRRLFAQCVICAATALSGVVALAATTAGVAVKTTNGPVRGMMEGGVTKFLGIPYAAPPLGDLRWMPPKPPKRHGLLNATQFGNTCPQVTTLGPFAGPTSTTEDCLYLNVFTKSVSGSKPVIVWIHGGGNVTGASNEYDSSKLVTGGPGGTSVVVVTINYRLGLFGFLSQDHLNAEGHHWGNYGIMDIQAALRWVQANIAALGGDPKNVTLGGQSAGAVNVTANLLSPLSAGLFHRAITQSLPISDAFFFAPAAALKPGNAFAAAAKCSDAACLRKLSVARILQLQGTPNARGPFITGPVMDGAVIPVSPETAWKSGNYNHMPIMGGATQDELTFNLAIAQYFAGPPQVPLTPEQYLANNKPAVLAEYPLSSYDGNPSLAQNRANSDRFICNGRRVLNQQASTNSSKKVYGYDFAYQQAPSYFPQMPNKYDPTGLFQPLAYHTGDIQFVFPGWHGGHLGVNLDQMTGQPRELQGAEIALSDQIVAAWINFAKTGDPNGPGVPEWPAFTSGKGPFLVQGIPNAIETDDQFSAKYKCGFWADQ